MSVLLFPFVFLMEFLFSIYLKATENPGVSVLLLSLTVSLLLRPLYKLIDKLKSINDLRKRSFSSVEQEIEDVYSGYTKFLYLKTLYRQNQYNPWNNHLPLLGTLVQLPFFFAAYTYLSPLEIFKGVSFLGITDLSRPDQMIPFAGIYINALPVLMTGLNLLTIRALDLKKQESKSLAIMSLMFLALLYNQPAALLLYWTFNNLVSFAFAMKVKKSDTSLWKGLGFNFAIFKEHSVPLMVSLTIYSLTLHLVNPIKKSFSGKASLIVGAFLLIGLVLVYYKSWRHRGKKEEKAFSILPICLFSIFPIFHFAYTNLEFLNLNYLFEILLLIILPQLLLILAVYGLTQSRWINSAFLWFIAASVFVFNITPLWVDILALRSEDAFLYQLALLVGLSVLGYRFFSKRRELFNTLSYILFAVTFIRFAVAFPESQYKVSKKELDIHVPDHYPKVVVRKPHVFLLVYDAYPNSSYFEYLGHDNSAIDEFLTSEGFKIYHDNLSLFKKSLPSISTIFQSSKDIAERTALVGHNPIDHYFEGHGYDRRYLAKRFFFKVDHLREGVEVRTPTNDSDESNRLLLGLMVGEFKYDFRYILKRLSEKAPWETFKSEHLYQELKKPTVTYLHSNNPNHSISSAKCLPNEKELFYKRLSVANKEIRNDVGYIKKHNPNSIIIVAGDHGPYLFGECGQMLNHTKDQIGAINLVDHFGAKLAIYWPENDFEEYDEIEYLQGVFHGVMAFMAKDKSILKHSPKGQVCINEVCASRTLPVTDGPDKGKMLFEIFKK